MLICRYWHWCLRVPCRTIWKINKGENALLLIFKFSQWFWGQICLFLAAFNCLVVPLPNTPNFCLIRPLPTQAEVVGILVLRQSKCWMVKEKAEGLCQSGFWGRIFWAEWLFKTNQQTNQSGWPLSLKPFEDC